MTAHPDCQALIQHIILKHKPDSPPGSLRVGSTIHSHCMDSRATHNNERPHREIAMHIDEGNTDDMPGTVDSSCVLLSTVYC